MTMVRPCRLITRQRSHMGFTDALTFIPAYFLSREPRPCGARVEPSYEHGVARPTPGREMVAKPLCYAICRARAEVRMRGPSSVIATVCSKCAEREPSTVE